MKKQQIHFDDWHRILMGEVPASFYVELVFRALMVYLILMFSMRAMGKRMSGQLSRNELGALVSLAAAVGVPMMAPNRGILPAMVIALVVIGSQRIIADRAAKNQSFEKISQGNISVLIADSIINIGALSRVGLAQAEVFAQLRGQSIKHLGMVDRFYMEANGAFTLIKKNQIEPGLCIIPDLDQDFINEMKFSEDLLACDTCGTTGPLSIRNGKCPNCGCSSWLPAVT